MARTDGAELVARPPCSSMEGSSREELHRILQMILRSTWLRKFWGGYDSKPCKVYIT